MKEFPERLGEIKGSRSVAEWARQLGLDNLVLHRSLKDRFLLATDKLAAVCYYENANPDWLISGRGNPYRVIRCDTDYDLSLQIGAYLTNEESWTLTVIARQSDNTPRAVVQSMPSRYPVEQRGKAEPLMVDYIALEIMVGPIGSSSWKAIESEHWRKRQQVTLDDDVVESLCKGGLGTYALMQDPGYLKAAAPLTDDVLTALASISIREHPDSYTAPLTPPEQRLLSTYRAMPSNDRERLLAIAEALKGFSG